MNVLILGGTGAMGVHLVSILSKTRNKIYVTSRNVHSSHGNIYYILGNAHEEDFLDIILAERHYDAIVDFMFYSIEEFKSRVSILLNNTDQYFCISSSRVYADSKTPIVESSPRLTEVIRDCDYLETNEYSQQKCKLEDVLVSTGYSNWTIIRPYITYSETRLQLGIYELNDWYYRFLHGRTIQLGRNIAEAITTLTYGYDVAQGIAALIGRKEALCEIFHITAEKTITWGRVLEIYCDEIEHAFGSKPKVLITPKDIFSSAAMRDMQVDYDRSLNRTFDNSKIRRFIDTFSFVDPEQGLRKCISEWVQSPKTLTPQWWRQMLIDRLTGEEAEREEFNSEDDYQKYLSVVRNHHFVRQQYIAKWRKRIRKIVNSKIK